MIVVLVSSQWHPTTKPTAPGNYLLSQRPELIKDMFYLEDTNMVKKKKREKRRRSNFRRKMFAPSAATVHAWVSVGMDLQIAHCEGSECWLALCKQKNPTKNTRAPCIFYLGTPCNASSGLLPALCKLNPGLLLEVKVTAVCAFDWNVELTETRRHHLESPIAAIDPTAKPARSCFTWTGCAKAR